MKNLTAGVMNMNMFGVPFTGPDVCGTIGEANEELCARWIQTSAFYPFARQVSDDAGMEPYNFQDADNIKMAKMSLMERLRYSRQLYTCLFEAQ
jgi:alpha-glucosidase